MNLEHRRRMMAASDPQGLALLPLGGDLHALVDRRDYRWAKNWKWSLKKSGDDGSVYAGRTYNYLDPEGRRRSTTVRLHRRIVQAPRGILVDHENRDPLDCRRCNLRAATPLQNARNAKKNRRGTTSKYKGVSKRKNRWVALICVNYKRMVLGSFTDEVEAARAYNEAALRHFGEFAAVNVLPRKSPSRLKVLAPAA